MKTLPLSEAKNNLSKLVDQLETTHEEVTITRNGRAAAVMVNPEDFEGWIETIRILSDKEFMKEIRHGIKALKKKARVFRNLEELTGIPD